MATTKMIQIVSITTALVASGGIATLSLFDIPLLQSQPASRSLPSIRWLFSRGSHIFPQAASISSLGFAYLAYSALPFVAGRSQGKALVQLLRIASNSHKVNGYLAAAALTFSIGPFTTFVMVPKANFEIIEMNERKGGTRSENSANKARQSDTAAGGDRESLSADQSVNGEGQENQFTDLSGPQSRTDGETSKEDDARAKELLGRFAELNAVRAVLMAAGGVIGLWAALL